MPKFTRRNFIQLSGVGLSPALISGPRSIETAIIDSKSPQVKFYGDSDLPEPTRYIAELQKANAASEIIKDRYGVGGVVEALEKKFASITGKEKAIFMPTGTMANQLAIAVLSGDKSKVFVQDESHVYRDEADAAQSVFNKRLMPLANGQPHFTVDQLSAAIGNLENEEAFATGIGAVSVETPVRRMDGRMVPMDELQRISAFCKSKQIPLHIDGARIFIASAWSGIPVRDYAGLSDSIYISLYKYLGASGGAILCGTKSFIDQMPHLVKVHGGSMYGNWTNAAMALYKLDGIEQRFQEVTARSKTLVEGINRIKGIRISALENGTNIMRMKLDPAINANKMHERMRNEFNIIFQRPNAASQSMLTPNETLLYQPADYVINAFVKSIA